MWVNHVSLTLLLFALIRLHLGTDKLYPFFLLDQKEPKNQACEIHSAKNFSAAESR
jgi:hypothetical protein